MNNHLAVVGVIGLGYVGLPLAVAFGKKYRTIAYDVSDAKIALLNTFRDPCDEVTSEELRAATFIEFTADPSDLSSADLLVIAVPTPIDATRRPDLSPLMAASATVGKHMKKGAIVVYESTVFPGVTEEICIPVLEEKSGMQWKQDFHVGYSPERINPGDKEHSLTKIIKVVSGDDVATLQIISHFYSSIIDAGVYQAGSIKVAEAAKVIENTQRDLNIALMNELSIIFRKINLDTKEVLQAAATKWNFSPYFPGLVGGHCIGVDPYYLTHLAEKLGFHPEVILAGRRINDSMASYVAQQTIKQLISCDLSVKGAKVTVLGLTFKENCADLRNSKVVDLVRELMSFGCNISVYDPIASASEVESHYDLKLTDWDALPTADALVVAVPHHQFKELLPNRLFELLRPGGVFTDVRGAFPIHDLARQGFSVWRL